MSTRQELSHPRPSSSLDRLSPAWLETGRFAAAALAGALSPGSYNSATREVIQKQIYFTAWEVLPSFIAVVAFMSAVLIQIVGETARSFNLYGYALELVIRILVLEILPLTTALLVAVRTGAAINTEVALMKIHNELEALELVGVDPLRFELVPRVIGGTVAVLSLTALGSIIALGLAHLIIIDLQPWSLPPGDFTRAIGKVFSVSAMLILWCKTLAFGLAVTIIPIAEGLQTPKRLSFAPVAVRRGMVRLFLALMLIEVAALAVTYVI